MYLSDEPAGQRGVTREIHGLYLTHEMTMMISVPVVIPKNPAIVLCALLQVDIAQALGGHLSVLKPHFHEDMLSQVGFFTSSLPEAGPQLSQSSCAVGKVYASRIAMTQKS